MHDALKAGLPFGDDYSKIHRIVKRLSIFFPFLDVEYYSTQKIKKAYLEAYKDPDFIFSREFAKLTLEEILKDIEHFTNVQSSLTFYLPKPDQNKEVLDNPFKILDFIKDIRNPQYSRKAYYDKH
jgi:hypothetical protein